MSASPPLYCEHVKTAVNRMQRLNAFGLLELHNALPRSAAPLRRTSCDERLVGRPVYPRLHTDAPLATPLVVWPTFL